MERLQLRKFILERAVNGLISIRVVPNASKNEVVIDIGSDVVKVKINEVPEEGKANGELIKFFKKELGLKVEIVKGQKNRNKILKLIKY